MTRKYRLFNSIFLIILILQLYAGFTLNNFLSLLTECAMVVVLIVFLISQTSLHGRFHKRIFTGLLFALAGNVLLMTQGKNGDSFIYSLLAFSGCLVFYIRAFTLDHKSNPHLPNKYFLPSIIGFGLLCAVFILFLSSHSGKQIFPVMMYAFMSSFTVIMAVTRWGKVNHESFKLIFTGAVFFLIFGALWLLKKYILWGSLPDAWIFLIYIVAQYLIVLGAVKRVLLVKQTEIN